MFTVASDGRIFYAELSTGRIGLLSPTTGSNATYFQVPDLCTAPGQGLFGLALAPDFAQHEALYAYATRRASDGICQSQVLRIERDNAGGLTMTVLLRDPYVGDHLGGRLLFGPDGYLYVSTGDGSSGLPTLAAAQAQRASAQDVNNVKGKLLRMTAAGNPAPGNPFGNLVFAYGFRNVFGYDFDPATGALWATDNGPEADYPGEPAGPGLLTGCNDELDLVTQGSNYGWGPTGSCAKPPAAPQNTNQDGPNPVMPRLNIEAASGITGARFCTGCGLGTEYEGRLFYVKYDYRDGFGAIHAATLDSQRSTIVSDAVVYQPPGPAPLSIERGPDGTLFYSDPNAIYRLVPGGAARAHLTLSETASPTSGATPLAVVYSYTLTNDGTDTLFHAAVTDDACSPATYQSGDTNHDSLLQPGETWTLTCADTYTQTGTYTDHAAAAATSTQTGLPANSNPSQTTLTAF
jgi:glucose/arabinose dehydrogenase